MLKITQLASCRITIYTIGSVGLQSPTLNLSCFLFLPPICSSHLSLPAGPSRAGNEEKMTSLRGDIMGAAPGASKGKDPSLLPWHLGVCRSPQSPAPDAVVAPALLPEQA